MVLHKIFEVEIIISSFCFARIVHNHIVLRYLLAVLRLLCALYGILTGEKVGLLFDLINWQLMLCGNEYEGKEEKENMTKNHGEVLASMSNYLCHNVYTKSSKAVLYC